MLTDPHAALKYTVTSILQLPNNSEDHTIYLVEDSNGDRLTLTYSNDFLKQTTVLEIVDLATKEYARATAYWPYKSQTREDTIKEKKEHPEYDKIELPVEIELNGVSAKATDEEWVTASIRDRRSSLRRAASSQFMERLERLRPAVSSAASYLEIFCAGLLKYILNNETCAKSKVTQVYADPDCTYDASFHYSCSDRQKQRIKEAIDAGKPIERY